eukprot:TRINITY_DN25479_c0_g1_i1.p1 TRINITY_DN25479_c0_g1~~TRINITY_DN25479_c0_g1_i1.p1  ORF type:complete len:241 (-),score=45.21 TRINITY_DN25479_c0_g1_i1:100-822(-)
MQRTHEFNPQDIANLGWALVRLKHPQQKEIIKTLSRISLSFLDQFKPQEIANLLYAQVLCKQRIKPFFPEVEKIMLKTTLKNYKDQELSILLWSFGKFRYLPCQEFLNLLNEEIIIRLPNMSPGLYVNIAKSYARLAYDPGVLLYRLAREAEKKLDLFEVKDVSNLIFAFAKLRRRDVALVDAVSQATERRLSWFSDQELESILKSCVRLGYNPVALQYLVETQRGGSILSTKYSSLNYQ